jgi:excisionase family DNA binding protein
MSDVVTPAMLAERWQCSERHVRNLIARGELPCFRLGQKLLRINIQHVEAFECRTTASDGSTESSASPGGKTEGDTVTRLEPLTRARLNALRQRSSQS